MKKREKKLQMELGDRIVFQVPDEMIPDFNDLKSVGFGDTEIVVECLKLALAEVKSNLLARRAKDSADLYARQAHYIKKAPASLPRTGPEAQTQVGIHKHPANSEPKKR